MIFLKSEKIKNTKDEFEKSYYEINEDNYDN